ncbi:MAG: phosphate ABC transporter permease, partial [Methylobacter sp.]
MCEINTQKHPPAINQASRSIHERWRLIKDTLAGYGVVAGGLAVIFAVVVIFFYLLYVVFPLFISAEAQPISQYDLPEAALGKTILLEIEEQNEVATRFTDSGQVVFFEAATGKTILTKAIDIPVNTHITS